MKKRPTHITFMLSQALMGTLEFGVDFDQMDRLADRLFPERWDEGPGLFPARQNNSRC